MSKKDIGIDLGTANTLIYLKSKGIVLNEPSVAAVSAGRGTVLSVGKKAKEMLGRTPGGINAVRPLENGAIADFDAAGTMLGFFVKKALKSNHGLKPRAVICVPTGITSVEKKAVIEAAMAAGIRRCVLVEEPMAAAIGAGLDVNAPSGCMVVDIGGGTTEAAVISLGGIVMHKSSRSAGDSMDRSIRSFIRRKYGLCTGEQSSEIVKNEIGTVMKNSASAKYHIRGRNHGNGLPSGAVVNGDDIRSAILPDVYSIIETVKSTLEETPPELSADILSSGIVLTGGGACIGGIDRMICSVTGMPVRIAESPLECVAQGLGMIIEDKNLMKKIFN